MRSPDDGGAHAFVIGVFLLLLVVSSYSIYEFRCSSMGFSSVGFCRCIVVSHHHQTSVFVPTKKMVTEVTFDAFSTRRH